ncbi:MAG: signal recognition particle-docking protein FtsY [Pseudomonadota bacterium]
MFGFKSASSLSGRLRALLGREQPAFPAEELTALLYEADLSAPIVARLARAAEEARPKDRECALRSMEAEVVRIALESDRPARPFPVPGAILLLGVNGSGKTTVAAKLARRYRSEGKAVILAAADTFRAGAIEQLKLWGARVGAEVVAQRAGADPGAVVFDAWQKAVADQAVMIADTAGRLHTKQPLTEELRKIVRVLGKDGRGAPHECFLVLDGTTGQNAVAQSREFVKAAPLTGLIVTKMDGTARGGSALASALELSLPIRYLGVGEKSEDLLPFEPAQFARELFRE